MQQKPSIRRMRGLGYGLLEVALGIAIAALLVAGAMMYFQNVNNERLAKEAVEQVVAVVAAAHTMYNGQPDYVGLNTARIARSPHLPKKFRKASGAMTNPYSGEFTILSQANPNGTCTWCSGNSLFMVLSYNLPKDACIRLATQVPNSRRLWVNGTAIMDGREWRSVATLDQAVRSCRASSNYIHWEFP